MSLFPGDSFLYFPERGFMATPEEIGLAYNDVFFQTKSNRKLHGWFIPHPSPKATFLFFHGNAGNISHRLEKLKIFHALGIATFIIDYSGYGKSEGKPSEENLYEDGMATYDHLHSPNVILYGESLGSAVAIELALQKPVKGLILEGAFTSLKELSKRHMPFLAPLAGNQYNNLEKIGSIQVPILFIHPTHDEICPFEGVLQLYEKATAKKGHLWLEEGSHNDAFFVRQEDYRKAIEEFLEGL